MINLFYGVAAYRKQTFHSYSCMQCLLGCYVTFAQEWMNLCSVISVAVATICPVFVSSTTTT